MYIVELQCITPYCTSAAFHFATKSDARVLAPLSPQDKVKDLFFFLTLFLVFLVFLLLSGF